jgi:hypothetical protein
MRPVLRVLWGGTTKFPNSKRSNSKSDWLRTSRSGLERVGFEGGTRNRKRRPALAGKKG